MGREVLAMAGSIGIAPRNLTCCPVGTSQAGKRSKLHSPACTAKRPELLESLLWSCETFQFKSLSHGSPSEAEAVPAQVPPDSYRPFLSNTQQRRG